MRTLILLSSLLLLSGCAQKMVPYGGDDVGIIALPVKATSEDASSSPYGYYYKLRSDADQGVVITIYPTTGDKFAFSQPIPAGDYHLSYFDIIADLSPSTITSISKKTVEANIPVTVEAGKISVLDYYFQVMVKSVDGESFKIYHRFQELYGEVEDQFIEKLKGMENADQWEVRI